MSRDSDQDLYWATVTALAVAIVALAIGVPYLNPSVTHTVALQNSLFWAAAIAPIAYLMDIVVRTSADYAQRLVEVSNRRR